MDWQVESGKRHSVFVSSTSADLGSCRRLVTNVLLQAGIYPVAQDHFGPDHRTIEQLITEKILSADAVICLIGHAFGTQAGADDNIPPRSYTQLEYELAQRFQKRCFLFVAAQSFHGDADVNESEARQASQTAFRLAIISGSHKYEQFSSIDELERAVRAAIQPIQAEARRASMLYEHPPAEPFVFVGREVELQQLQEAILDRQPSMIAVIGMAGQGKTSLVAHAIKTIHPFPMAAGIWVTANRIGFDFTHFLDAALQSFLGSLFDKTAYPRWEARLARLIRYMQDRPTLIVIDGVEGWLKGWQQPVPGGEFDDVASRRGAVEGLDDFLTQATALQNGSHVILTSRALPAALDLVQCRIVPVLPVGHDERSLQGLTPSAAAELLKALGLDATSDRLSDTAARLGYHPLALTCFASVARKLGKHWESSWSRQSLDPLRMVNALLDEALRRMPNSQISVALLKKASLCLDDVPVALLTWLLGWDSPKTPISEDDVIRQSIALAEWNIVTWRSEALSITFHPLVREHFATLLSADEAATTHSRFATWYGAQPVAEDATSLASLRPLVLAVKHSLYARQPDRALQYMFGRSQSKMGLHGLLLRHGHLWECAELLLEIEGEAEGLAKAQCIVARANVLNQLELAHKSASDLDVATDIFKSGEGDAHGIRSIGLAQCYGLKGIIAANTAKATDSIAYYDAAVALLDGARPTSPEIQIDFVKTLSNRGLAKLAIGDWDASITDFKHALRTLDSLGGERDSSLHELHCEILINSTLVDLDAFRPAVARAVLEPLHEDLHSHFSGLRGSQIRPYFRCAIALAAASNMNGDSTAANRVVSDVVDVATKMELEGRADAGWWLAQALVNRTKAHLLRSNASFALEDCSRALSYYRREMEKGAFQVEGQLASALFHSAEAHFRLEMTPQFSADMSKAITISRQWIRDWLCECNIANVFLTHAVNIVSYLGEEHKSEMRLVLDTVLDLRKAIQGIANPSAALRRAAVVLDGDLLK